MSLNIVVVGADGGLGEALLRKTLKQGHSVIATVSRGEKIAALRSRHDAVKHVFALDLGDPECCRSDLRDYLEQTGCSLDVVVVCAATSPMAAAETTPLADVTKALEINCVSNLAIYQATIPLLRQSNGRIIFTGSLSGKVGLPLQAGYCASKFALEGLADVLRRECRAFGVDVVLLQPGGMASPMIHRSLDLLRQGCRELGGEERALYEHMFQQWERRIEESLAQQLPTSPEAAAEAAYAAIIDPKPAARYPIGDDARALLSMARDLPDFEMDQALLAALGLADQDG